MVDASAQQGRGGGVGVEDLETAVADAQDEDRQQRLGEVLPEELAAGTDPLEQPATLLDVHGERHADQHHAHEVGLHQRRGCQQAEVVTGEAHGEGAVVEGRGAGGDEGQGSQLEGDDPEPELERRPHQERQRHERHREHVGEPERAQGGDRQDEGLQDQLERADRQQRPPPAQRDGCDHEHRCRVRRRDGGEQVVELARAGEAGDGHGGDHPADDRRSTGGGEQSQEVALGGQVGEPARAVAHDQGEQGALARHDEAEDQREVEGAAEHHVGRAVGDDGQRQEPPPPGPWGQRDERRDDADRRPPGEHLRRARRDTPSARQPAPKTRTTRATTARRSPSSRTLVDMTTSLSGRGPIRGHTGQGKIAGRLHS